MTDRVISHYRVLEEIGRGGVGVVYRAQDLRLERTVALKFLHPHILGDPQHRARLVREARAAAALDHPNVYTVYDVDEHDGRIFLAMELIDGTSLKDRIRSGPLPVEFAASILIQMAAGLRAAHEKGVIHRDVKSGNVMVTRHGHATITDFGLAHLAEGPEDTLTTEIVGTPSCMSPEQLRGEAPDSRADIWSWGVVAYEALGGRLPFSGETMPALVYSVLHNDPDPLHLVNPEVPRELAAIVVHAMAKRAEDRYATFDPLLEDLRAVRDGPLGVLVSDPAPPAQRSIAVLPFVDMSPDRDQEYFCDGLAEEIIHDLGRLPGLRVASRTSSFAFKGMLADVRRIGRSLGVDTLVEGSVRKHEGRVRITAELIATRDGCQIWSERFDRKLEDVFSVQEEISQSVVAALEIELTERDVRALRKAPTHDILAYEHYLRGRQAFYLSNRAGLEAAIAEFGQATEKDPAYARAWAGMADCHSYLHTYHGADPAHLDRALELSDRALRLAPDLAEARAARGLAVALGNDFDGAAREFEAALKLNPALFEAHYFYGRACFAAGRLEEAAERFRDAARFNPRDHQAPSLLGFVLRALGRSDEADEPYRRTVELALRRLEHTPDDSRAMYLLGQALIELAEPEKGLRWVRRAAAQDPDDPYIVYGTACAHARCGNVDEGLKALNIAVRAGFAQREWIDNDIDLNPLRADPRFDAILSRLG